METIFFSILLAIPQTGIFLFLLFTIPKNILKTDKESTHFNRYLPLEILTCLISPIIGYSLNQFVEPSGDLNPGSSFQVFPPILLTIEMVLFFLSLLTYYLSLHQLQKSKQKNTYFLYVFSCASLGILSLIPSSFLILSGAIVIGFFPIIGIPILAPIINSCIFISKLIVNRKEPLFHDLKSTYKIGFYAGVSFPLLLIAILTLTYSPIQTEWLSLLKEISILSKIIQP